MKSRNIKIVLLLIIIINFIIITCDLISKNECNFNTVYVAYPNENQKYDSIYCYFEIHIDDFDSSNVYTCIIGDFDTVKMDKYCVLRMKNSYDSIPDSFRKGSKFSIIFKRNMMKTNFRYGFIRQENSVKNKYKIFKLVFSR